MYSKTSAGARRTSQPKQKGLIMNQNISIKEQLLTIRRAIAAAFVGASIGFIVGGLGDYNGVVYFDLSLAVNFSALMACCFSLAVIIERLTRGNNDDPFTE